MSHIGMQRWKIKSQNRCNPVKRLTSLRLSKTLRSLSVSNSVKYWPPAIQRQFQLYSVQLHAHSCRDVLSVDIDGDYIPLSLCGRDEFNQFSPWRLSGLTDWSTTLPSLQRGRRLLLLFLGPECRLKTALRQYTRRQTERGGPSPIQHSTNRLNQLTPIV